MNIQLKRSSYGLSAFLFALATVFTVVLAASPMSVKAATIPDHKIGICHATNSATNPYVYIVVDKNAADGRAGNSQGNPNDHFGEHTGPLAATVPIAQGLKNQHIKWGDIIPPIEGVHEGLNWTTEGQEILANGCNQNSNFAFAEIGLTAATCETGQTLVYADSLVNAVFKALSIEPGGDVWPKNYSITFQTNPNNIKFDTDLGGVLSANEKEVTFTGTLAGPLTGEQCDEPEALVATAAVSTTAATCDEPETLVYGAITNAVFSGDADDGTSGPGSYNVLATADQGALFAVDADGVNGDRTTQTFTGTLAGPDDELCPPDEEPEVLVATAAVSTTAATCSAPETLVWGDIDNATFSGTPDGTKGPGDYNVVATADEGAEFANAENVDETNTTKTFTGTLDAQLANCGPQVLGDSTTNTPTSDPLPASLPSTGSSLPIVASVIASLMAAIAVAGHIVGRIAANRI